uniref:Uncharacterized protein n=1 Tax=Knipowitschia caucasica TaxID=637954 RepID=A0AAV2IQS9_KNICA
MSRFSPRAEIVVRRSEMMLWRNEEEEVETVAVRPERCVFAALGLDQHWGHCVVCVWRIDSCLLLSSDGCLPFEEEEDQICGSMLCAGLNT